LIVGLDDRTAELHVWELREDGLLLIPEEKSATTLPSNSHRIDFEELAKKAGSQIMTNTVAAGVCMALLGAPFDHFKNALKATFDDLGEKRVQQNIKAAQLGYESVADTTFKPAWQWQLKTPKGRLVDGAQAVAFGVPSIP
jgi:2-oxoglutarate ferredoxin oxidoreductase subunit alpha